MSITPIDWPALLTAAGCANPSQTVNATLEQRCHDLAGCQGRWVLHLAEPRHTYGRSDEYLDSWGSVWVADGQPYLRLRDWPEMLAYCVADHWRNTRLIFLPDCLDDNCSWPGGYRRSSIYEANANVARDEYTEKDGLITESPSLGVDPRFMSEELRDAILSLEDYPVLDESEWSQVETNRQDEAWESWAASEWWAKVADALQGYAPTDADGRWGEEIIEKVSDGALFKLFYECCETTGTYWEEGSDGEPWIDLQRVAAGIARADLADLTGLPLLSPGQEWRMEPYPWPGADPSPLAPALPIDPAGVEVPA